jgi:hypothetical protein
MKIDSLKAYWNAVDLQWDNLLDILSDQLDMDSLAFEKPGNPESPMTGRGVLAELIHLKKTRDQRICRYFNAAWGLASEAYCYSKPAWGLLCDLCSEEWVFNEVETQTGEQPE